MSQSRNHNASSHAPLQARIAGVALATTVLALVAACLCFMLQQWSVARQESRANHEVLVQMAAAGAAAPLADHNMVGVYRLQRPRASPASALPTPRGAQSPSWARPIPLTSTR
jgi:hypothetical protein